MSVAVPDLLAGLDPEQRTAAETLLGPVCILAGAGTGKTRALTHRIAHGVATGVYDPARVLALTFTTRAAGELRTRLRQLGAGGVTARTFHSAALSQLSHFWPDVVGGSLPRILDHKGRLLGQAAESLRIRVDTAALRDVAAEIEWRKITRLTLDDYARAAASRALPPGLGVDEMVALQQAYEQIKDDRRQLDFEDVLLATAGMIESEPRIAEQVRGAVPVLRGRRVPGCLAAAAGAARALARHPHRTVRRRRREPDHLLVRGGVERLPAGLRGAVSGGDDRAPRDQLPVGARRADPREPAHAGAGRRARTAVGCCADREGGPGRRADRLRHRPR